MSRRTTIKTNQEISIADYENILRKATELQYKVKPKSGRFLQPEHAAKIYSEILSIFSNFADPNGDMNEWIPKCIKSLHNEGLCVRIDTKNIKGFFAAITHYRTKLKNILDKMKHQTSS